MVLFIKVIQVITTTLLALNNVDLLLEMENMRDGVEQCVIVLSLQAQERSSLNQEVPLLGFTIKWCSSTTFMETILSRIRCLWSSINFPSSDPAYGYCYIAELNPLQVVPTGSVSNIVSTRDEDETRPR